MIAVVGGYGVGMTMVVPRAPEAGETVAGGRLAIGHGGKGSNQAVGIRRLGVDAALLTAIGRDAAAEGALAMWAEEGVDADGVVRCDASTMTGFIVVDEAGENRIALADGALAEVTATAVDGFADRIRAARMLVVSLEIPEHVALAAVRVAHDAGVPVLLDPAPATRDRELVGLADVLAPNRGELELVVGMPGASVDACLDALRTWHSGAVVVTCGADGAVVDVDSARTRIAAVPAEDVVDTTGAGDAFTAALAVALVEGRDLEDAASFAAAAGACAVGAAEVLPSLPSRAAVERLLAPRREETVS